MLPKLASRRLGLSCWHRWLSCRLGTCASFFDGLRVALATAPMATYLATLYRLPYFPLVRNNLNTVGELLSTKDNVFQGLYTGVCRQKSERQSCGPHACGILNGSMLAPPTPSANQIQQYS